MNHKINILPLIALGLLSACTQTTPTMMNTSPVELVNEAVLEQVPAQDIDKINIDALAAQYRKSGNSPLDLTMTYDPAAKDFTAMNALHRLKDIKNKLYQKGVSNITAQTLAVPQGSPSLMISYDMVRAQAPSDCTPMPGLANNETGRFIGDYKFGCATESMIAKQIARPSDLQGNSVMDARAARRDSVVVEGYSAGVPREKLDGVERDDLVVK